MPLSDRTKAYLVASAVVAVAAGNVLFGLSRTTAPVAVTAVVPATSTSGGNGQEDSKAAAPINQHSNAAQTQSAVAPVAPIASDEPKPQCDVAACAAAYHSFKESDCMYQPNNGPRRLCTKGKPPQ